jgi:hypothetical protein
MDGPNLNILHWKENAGDEDESLLGIIRLKNGREFLITSVRDPEGQWFRVYGIRMEASSLSFQAADQAAD